MIILSTLISAVFLILSYNSYGFLLKTLNSEPCVLVHKEHQMWHIGFSVTILLTSTALSTLYVLCTLIPILLPEYIPVITTFVFMKNICHLLFAGTCILIVKHITDEEDPTHRFFYRSNHRRSDDIGLSEDD